MKLAWHSFAMGLANSDLLQLGELAELLEHLRVLHQVLDRLLQLLFDRFEPADVPPTDFGHFDDGLPKCGRVGEGEGHEVVVSDGHRAQYLGVDEGVILQINSMHLLPNALEGGLGA